MKLITNLIQRLACRVLGHRWHFLYDRKNGGKVYECHRCHREAAFIR